MYSAFVDENAAAMAAVSTAMTRIDIGSANPFRLVSRIIGTPGQNERTFLKKTEVRTFDIECDLGLSETTRELIAFKTRSTPTIEETAGGTTMEVSAPLR